MANISMNVDQELTTIFNVSLVIELLKDQYDIDITDEYALELLGISPNPWDAPILHMMLHNHHSAVDSDSQ